LLAVRCSLPTRLGRVWRESSLQVQAPSLSKLSTWLNCDPTLSVQRIYLSLPMMPLNSAQCTRGVAHAWHQHDLLALMSTVLSALMGRAVDAIGGAACCPDGPHGAAEHQSKPRSSPTGGCSRVACAKARHRRLTAAGRAGLAAAPSSRVVAEAAIIHQLATGGLGKRREACNNI
jgi:hypothetical protein